MNYARSCGITWNKHDNSNIDWMRCCMAINQLNNTTVSVQTSKQLDLSKISGAWESLDKKAKMAELLKNNSKQELMDFAKANGISWKEDPASEGINWMRASMAIQKFIDGKSILDLSTSATFAGSSTQSKQTTPPKPKVDESLIPIPANATERTKNIIEVVNKITDENVIKSFTEVGMIGEDPVSTNYILYI